MSVIGMRIGGPGAGAARVATPRGGMVAGIERGTAAYTRLLVALGLGGLANFALLYYVQPLLPQLARAFGTTTGASGLALSATTVAMIVGLLLAGPLAHRFGRVRVMSGSLVATGLAGALSAAATTWDQFLAARLVMGVGLAILPACALASLRDLVSERAHLHANSVYIAGTAVGGALGRLAPLPLAALGGWRVPTLALAVLSIVAGMVMRAALPRERAGSHGIRIRELVTGGVGALRDRPMLTICGLGFANAALVIGIYNAISFRLTAAPFDLGHAEALIYLAYPVCILAPAAFRAAADRWGRRRATSIGLALNAIAVLLLIPATVLSAFAGLALLTFAFMGNHSILSGWAVHRGHRVGLPTTSASSAYLTSFYAGSTVAGAGATHVWALAGWPGVTLAGLLVLGAAVALTAVTGPHRPAGIRLRWT